MGQLLNHYRLVRPDDNRSSFDILSQYASEKGEAWLQQYPEDYQRWLDGIGMLRPRGAWEEGMRGGRRAFEGTKGTVKSGVGMYATKFGAKEMGKDWDAAAQKNYAEASQPHYRASGASPTAALVGEALPSLAESLLVGAGGALAGGMLAPGPDVGDVVTVPGGFVAGILNRHAIKRELRERITKELGTGATEKAVKAKLNQELGVSVLKPYGTKELMTQAATRRGIVAQAGTRTPEQLKTMADILAGHKKLLFQQGVGAITTGLNSIGLSQGEIYSQLAADPDVDLDTAFNHAFLGGIVAGIPDTFLPAMILGKTLKALKGGAPLTRKATDSTYRRVMDSWPGRYSKAIGVGGGTEAVTEAFQTWVGIVAEKSAKGMSVNDAIADSSLNNLTWSQQQEMIHAAKVGFVAGVMGGGGGEVFSSLAGGTQPPVDAEPGAAPTAPTPALEGADPIPVDVAHIDHKGRADVDALVAEEMADTAELDDAGQLIRFNDPSPELLTKIHALQREGGDESLQDYYISRRAAARAALTPAPAGSKPAGWDDAPPEVAEAAEAAAGELFPEFSSIETPAAPRGISQIFPHGEVAPPPAEDHIDTSPGHPELFSVGTPKAGDTPATAALRAKWRELDNELLAMGEKVRVEGTDAVSNEAVGAVAERQVIIEDRIEELEGQPAQPAPVAPSKIKIIKPQAKEKRGEVLGANIGEVAVDLEKDIESLETEIQGIHAKLEEMSLGKDGAEKVRMELSDVKSYSGVVVNKETGEPETIVKYGDVGLAELDQMNATSITLLPQSSTVSMTQKLQKQKLKLESLRAIQSGELNILDDNFPTELLAWQTQEADKSDRRRTESGEGNLKPGPNFSYPAFYDRSDEDSGTEAGSELVALLEEVLTEMDAAKNPDNDLVFDPKTSKAFLALGDMLTSEARYQSKGSGSSTKSHTTRMVVLRKLDAKAGDSDAYHIVPIHKGKPKAKKGAFNVNKPAGEPAKGGKTMTLEEALEGYDLVGSMRMSVPIRSSTAPVRWNFTARQWDGIAVDLRSRRQQSASKTGVGEWTPPTSTETVTAEDETMIPEESLNRQSRLETSKTGGARADSGSGNTQAFEDDESAVEVEDPAEANAAAQALANIIQAEILEGKHAHHSEAPDLSVPVKEWVNDSVTHLLSEGLAVDNGEIAYRLLLDKKKNGIGLYAQDKNTQKSAGSFELKHGMVALLAKFNVEIRNTKEQHERNRSAGETGETGQEGSAAPDAGPGSDSVRTAHQEANKQTLSEADLTPSDGTTLVHAQELTTEGDVVDVEASVVPITKQAVGQNAEKDRSDKARREDERANHITSEEWYKELEKVPTDTREKGVVEAFEKYLDKHPELRGIVNLVRGPAGNLARIFPGEARGQLGVPMIEVNLNLMLPSEVEVNIDHELAHYIYKDSRFTQAFEALWSSLSESQQTKISIEVARIYGSELATEEERVRAFEFIRKETLRTEEQRTLWDKLVLLLEKIYQELTATSISRLMPPSDPQALAAHMVAYAREAIVTGHQRGDTIVERHNRQAIASLQDPDATLLSFYDTFKDLNWPSEIEEYKDWMLAGKPIVTSRTSIKEGEQKKVKTAEEIDDIAELLLSAFSFSRPHREIHAHFPNIVVEPPKLSIEHFFVDAETREPLDMSDPLEFIRASDAGQHYWTVQQENPDALHDALVGEARDIILARINAIQRLSAYFVGATADESMLVARHHLQLQNAGALYTYTEALMIVHHAAKFSYGVDGKQHKIGVDNRHPVMDLSGAGAAYIRDALREGKPIKQAFKEAAIRMDEEAKQAGVKSGKKGWHIFKRSDKTEDIAALAAASAGTQWCTQNGNTAGSYLSEGDFHAYYADGVVQIMLRTQGGKLAEAPRGRLDGQEVHADYADIAGDYLRSGKVEGGEGYLHDRDFVRALKKLGPNPTAADVDPILKDGLYENIEVALEGGGHLVTRIKSGPTNEGVSGGRIKRRAAGYNSRHYPKEVTDKIYNALTANGSIPLDMPLDADGVLTGDVVVERFVDAETAIEATPRLPDGIRIITGDIKRSKRGLHDAEGVAWKEPGLGYKTRVVKENAEGVALDLGNLEELGGGIFGFGPELYTGLNRPSSITAPKLRFIGEIKESNKNDEFPVLTRVGYFGMNGASANTAEKGDWLHLPELVEVDAAAGITKVDAPKLKSISMAQTEEGVFSNPTTVISYSRLPALQTVDGNLRLVGTNIEQEVELTGFSEDHKAATRGYEIEMGGMGYLVEREGSSEANLTLLAGSTIKLKNRSIHQLTIGDPLSNHIGRDVPQFKGDLRDANQVVDLGRLRQVDNLDASNTIIPGITKVTLRHDHFHTRNINGDFVVDNIEMPDLEVIGNKTIQTELGVAPTEKVHMIGPIILPKLTKVHGRLEIGMHHEHFNTIAAAGFPEGYLSPKTFNLGRLESIKGPLTVYRHKTESHKIIQQGDVGWYDGYIPLPSLKEVDHLDNGVAIHAPKLKKVGEAPSKKHLKTFYPNVLHDKAVIKEAGDEYIDDTQPAKPFWAGDSMPYSQWLNLRRTGYKPIGVPPKHVGEMTEAEREEWDAKIKEWMKRGRTLDALTDPRSYHDGTEEVKMNRDHRTGADIASALDPFPGEAGNQVLRNFREQYPDAESFLTKWNQFGEQGVSNKLFSALAKMILEAGLAKGVKIVWVKEHELVKGGQYGSYNHRTQEITIYVGDHTSFERVQETVMHEILHNVLGKSTWNYLNHKGDKLPLATRELFKKLDGMLAKARSVYTASVGREVDWETEGGPRAYGLTNLSEFISETMSNSEFQEFLEEIPGQKSKENFLQSLMGVLKNIILDILTELSMTSTAHESKVSDTLLGDAIETALLAIHHHHKDEQGGRGPNESVQDSNLRRKAREGSANASEVEHRLLRIDSNPRISAPEKDASKDSINNELNLKLNYASWAHVQDVLKEMFAKFNIDQLNQDGLEFKKFVSKFARISNTPEQMMQLINQRLVDNGENTIDGNVSINNVANKDRASHDAYQVLYDIFLHMQKHRAKSEAIVSNDLAAIEASNAELQQILGDYENAATLSKASDKALRNFITSLSRKTPAAQEGMLSKVAAHLKSKGVDIVALKRVQKILAPEIDSKKDKNLVEREKAEAMNKLMNLVDSVAMVGWMKGADGKLVATDSAINFRAQGIGETVALIESSISPGSELQEVLNKISTNKDDQTAALVLMAYTGQSNQHIFDLSVLRKIENRGSINDILKLAMSADITAVNKARKAISLTKTNAVLADRLLAKVSEHKKHHRKRVKGMRDARAYIEFDNSTRRIIVGKMSALESALAIERRPSQSEFKGSSLWQGTEGSSYLVPTSADQSTASLLKTPEKKLTLIPRKDLYGEGPMTPEEYHSKLVGEMEAMFLWLNHPNREHDSTYNFVERTYNVISGEHMAREYSARRNSVVLAAIGTFRDDLERTGSPVLKNIIHRLAKFVALSKRHRALEPLSVDWVLEESRAIKALGLNKEPNAKQTFHDLVYNPALAFFESNQQILQEADTPEEAINIGLRRVKGMLWDSGTKVSAALKSNPQAWEHIEKLLRTTGKMSKAIIEEQEGMGLKVKHGGGKREHFRRAIGAELFTVSRNMRARITTQVIDMSKEGSPWMHKWSKIDSAGVEVTGRSPRRAKDVREAVMGAYLGTDEQQAALRAAAIKQSSGDVWSLFVRPLVEKDGESVFDEGAAIGEEDGRFYRLASRGDVVDAFNSVEEGDVIGFAEKLYELTGGNMSGDQESREAMAAHVSKVATKLQETFNTLYQNVNQATSPDQVRDTGQQLRRVMLDARAMEGFPKEWVSFSTFEEQQVLSIMRVFSAHAAFGQRLEPLNQEFKVAEQEFNDQKNMMESLSAAISEGMPRSEAKQKAKDAYGPAGWHVIKSAADNLKGLSKIREQVGAMIANEAAATPVEMGSMYELLQTLTGLVVQSFKTAIIDTSSMFVMPFAKYGVNRIGIRESLKGFNTLVQGAGSFWPAGGHGFRLAN